ncbi:MAG: MBOAT family O-acyltransferase [Gaiellales bacterium]
MLASFQILLVITLVTSLVYNAVPSRFTGVRRGLILAVSAVAIYAYNPRTLAIAILVTLFAFGVFVVARRHPTRGWIPWLVVLPLVVNAVSEVALHRNWGDILPFPTGSPQSAMVTSLATLGLSFYAFKLYVSIKEGLRLGDLRLRDMATCVLFYPAFPIGPIDGAARFDHAAIGAPPDVRRWLLGLARIGMGGAKVYLVTGWITEDLPARLGLPTLLFTQTHAFTTPGRSLAYMVLSFLFLYLNFSGFTDMAIGAGLMFNLRLTENFHYPLLSTSIQDFWQRWNLSLSGFITRYMFKPMLRSTGRPVASLVVTFTLIGMWHELSFGYLFWGLAHGSALGATLWLRQRRRGREHRRLPPLMRQLGGMAVTLLFVAFVSAIANLPTLERTQAFVEALVGR